MAIFTGTDTSKYYDQYRDQYMSDKYQREMQYMEEQLKRKLEQDAPMMAIQPMPVSQHKQPNLILLLEEV